MRSPGSMTKRASPQFLVGVDDGEYVLTPMDSAEGASDAPATALLRQSQSSGAVLGAGGITCVDSWVSDTALQQAVQVTKDIASVSANLRSEWGPTRFLDLSATTPGTGTIRQPWTPAQINAGALLGRQRSVTLGVRRGSSFRGLLNFGVQGSSGIGGDALDGGALIICPYGDHPRLPTIYGSVVRTDWVSVGNGVWVITMDGFANLAAAERDVFQNNARLLRVTSQAALAAASGGVQLSEFSAGRLTISIKPFDGENPNLGQIEVQAIEVAFRVVIHNDGARTGNVQIHGIHSSGARNTCMQVQINAAARGLLVNNCIYTNSGTDTRDLSIAHDGLSIYGLTSAARITDVTVSNGYAGNVINNAIEFAHVDGALTEGNLARNTGGACIVEFWDNCRNTTTRFNQGFGDPLHPRRRILGQVASAGFWLVHQTDGGVADTGIAHNNNHDVHHNYIEGSMRCWQFRGGTGIRVHHNTYRVRWANPTGFSNVEGGLTTGGQAVTINHSNNAYVLDVGGTAESNDGIQFLRLAAAAGYSGNNNVYMGPAGACSWWVNGNSRLFLSDFVTDVGGSQDTASRTNPVNSTSAGGGAFSVPFSTVMLDDDGRPLGHNSNLRNRGVSGLTTTVNGNAVPYLQDLEGKPMSAAFPSIGCYA
ncbi:hypothetical protein UFOVP708_4 [uncultured Caudovirales phage]|uniref:Uncharacterized protein n=1 Tax=uncultured Caudovirales phage TaxID=2100421 RepID=A0A6J5NIB3_9CAUD|nr:hypothetical protein UFOVP708_4 [uncultured Caudovirales phage]